MDLISKLTFNFRYLGNPPWDTGISPPELMAFINSHAPGWALDLGCGTGTNVITLAQHGWNATGVDFIPRAIRAARRKAQTAGVNVDFQQGDVTRLDGIDGPFDLILDIGCFHNLDGAGMQRYIDHLGRLLADQGTFLMYGFFKATGERGSGLTDASMKLLNDHLKLQDRQDGFNRRQMPSAWFTYTR